MRGADNVTIHADTSTADLYQARFEGTAPDVRVEDGTIRVDYPRTWHPLDWRKHSASHRRRILVQLNRHEKRHNLARKIFHGEKGEVRKKYREGQEDQLGALGLVVNAVCLWNTLYLDEAVRRLREDGEEVADEDLARVSPLIRAQRQRARTLRVQPQRVGGRRRAALFARSGGDRRVRIPNIPARRADSLTDEPVLGIYILSWQIGWTRRNLTGA